PDTTATGHCGGRRHAHHVVPDPLPDAGAVLPLRAPRAPVAVQPDGTLGRLCPLGFFGVRRRDGAVGADLPVCPEDGETWRAAPTSSRNGQSRIGNYCPMAGLGIAPARYTFKHGGAGNGQTFL